MESYEKQQEREVLYTFLLAVLGSGFLIFFCIAEKNYELLALAIGAITVWLFRWIGGAIPYYQEKSKE